MAISENYDPSTALTAEFSSRSARGVSRLWEKEKLLHDHANAGFVTFFEGSGDDPTVLAGYDRDKLWLRAASGVTSEAGTIRIWNGDAPETSLSSWPELTEEAFAARLVAIGLASPSGNLQEQIDALEDVYYDCRLAGVVGDAKLEYCGYQTTSGSQVVTISDTPIPFTSADIGKLIELPFAGVDGAKLISTITAVGSSTITIAHTAGVTNPMITAHPVVWGTDDGAALQGWLNDATAARRTPRMSDAPGSLGAYLTTVPLTYSLPANSNATRHGHPLPVMTRGATIRAMAAMTNLFTIGGTDSDYSQFLFSGHVSGGCFDGNFLADNCVHLPFVTDTILSFQWTKNFKKSGWLLGSASAPASSAGVRHIQCDSDRDSVRIGIDSITHGATPVITTKYAHGFTTGRIVVMYLSGPTDLQNKFFEIEVTGARTFTLRDINSTGYPAYVADSGYVCQTFPCMRLPRVISGITAANPGVVTTTTPHGLTTGSKVFLDGFYGMSGAIGVRTITVINSTSYSIGVDTSAMSAHSGAGWAVEWVAPSEWQQAIRDERHTDAVTEGGNFRGVRAVRTANQDNCGWDGKHYTFHTWCIPQQGEIWSALWVGGDNHVDGIQVDAPFKFGAAFVRERNTASGIKLNYDPSLLVIDGYASMFYLHAAGETINGDGTDAWWGGVLLSNLCGFKATSSYRGWSECFAGSYRAMSSQLYYVINPQSPQIPYQPIQVATIAVSGGTPTINTGGYNVSSVVKNGTGDFIVSSTNPIAVTIGASISVVSSGGGPALTINEYLGWRSLYSRRYLIKYESAGTFYAVDPDEFSIMIMG